ncbi:lipoyl(octanoyl) transferase [Emergomyces pasteurianus Ep9510]|uniref:Octanoyltransferase n=1 Tax=Emergomyces pasteurianus Ep9510 TaxID=1447872 RepID=A0A1J9Q956_9EURO|nr:lipoyl(octanoyl) transferase [Emergomyces pasteurianus Ep9510]
MRLAHLHIPHLVPFTHASHLQQTLVSRLLTHKKLSDTFSNSPTHLQQPPPDPTILTFTPHPVYTTGRRDLPPSNPTSGTSSASTPSSNPHSTLDLNLPTPLHPIRHLLTPTSSQPAIAEFQSTLRGGQTTYHGPGQLVAYTILDLRRLRLGPRQHIRLLERSVLDVLDSYGVEGAGLSEKDPGVWVDNAQSRSDHNRERKPEGNAEEGENGLLPRKVAAVGVHLRRNVSSYGIGLNVTEEPMWFFRQITACGLEGRDTTSLVGCGVKFDNDGDIMRQVAERFVSAFVKRVNEVGTAEAVDCCCETGGGVGIEEVYSTTEREVLGDGGE